MKIAAPPPDKYALLVNPVSIRGSIRRQFQNKLSEVLRELLQNSQRACASRVDVNTITDHYSGKPVGWSYQDNGHGLRAEGSSDPRDAFLTLLQMGTSHFENSNVPQQKPMGLGFHAMLAHDQVQKVVLTSDWYELEIDPDRWWSDLHYAQTWSERLQRIPNRQDGTLISVYCGEEMLDDLPHALPEPGYVAPTCYSGGKNYASIGKPAEGYEGILEVFRDWQKVDTRIPNNARIDRPLITTEFRGSRLDITISRGHSTSYVNWYGQIVPVPLYDLKFLLTVNQGAPVNPIAPSREKLIEDEAYRALLQTVKDSFLNWALKGEDPLTADKSVVYVAQKLAPERWLRESPYFLARTFREPDRQHGWEYEYDPRQVSDWDGYTRCMTSTVLRYDNAPELLLHDDIVELTMENGDLKETPWSDGIYHWLRMIEGHCFEANPIPANGNISAYLVNDRTYYNPERLSRPVKQLYWRPGEAHFPNVKCYDDRAGMYKRGTWGLGTADEIPETWQELDQDQVCFNGPGYGDIPSWAVACEDPLDFLENGDGLIACLNDKSDDSDHDGQFWTQVEDLKRKVFGNAIPTDFNWYDLNAAVEGRVTAVHFIYDVPREGKPDAVRIESVKVEWPAGQEQPSYVPQEPATFKLYGVREVDDD